MDFFFVCVCFFNFCVEDWSEFQLQLKQVLYLLFFEVDVGQLLFDIECWIDFFFGIVVFVVIVFWILWVLIVCWKCIEFGLQVGFQICCVVGGEEFCGGDDEEGVVYVCCRDVCGCFFVIILCCFGGLDFGLLCS